MIEIKDLLSRFNNILLSEEGKKETVRKIISDLTQIQIKKEEIEIKKGVIYLNIKPIYKNEIFIKQEQIFEAMQQSFLKKSPTQIR